MLPNRIKALRRFDAEVTRQEAIWDHFQAIRAARLAKGPQEAPEREAPLRWEYNRFARKRYRTKRKKAAQHP